MGWFYGVCFGCLCLVDFGECEVCGCVFLQVVAFVITDFLLWCLLLVCDWFGLFCFRLVAVSDLVVLCWSCWFCVTICGWLW